jgi:hypothetical protein
MTKSLYALPVLAMAGLCAGTSVSATEMHNGLAFNGLAFNGTNLNGKDLNGLAFNGKDLNGLAFNGASRDGAAAAGDGVRAVEVVLPNGAHVTLK